MCEKYEWDYDHLGNKVIITSETGDFAVPPIVKIVNDDGNVLFGQSELSSYISGSEELILYWKLDRLNSQLSWYNDSEYTVLMDYGSWSDRLGLMIKKRLFLTNSCTRTLPSAMPVNIGRYLLR